MYWRTGQRQKKLSKFHHSVLQLISYALSTLTLVGPLWLCSNLAVVGADSVFVTVVWVCQTIWRRFAMSLAQQSVEAIVEAGAEAKVSSVAGVVQGPITVLLWCGEQTLVVVIVGGLVEVVLLEGGE